MMTIIDDTLIIRQPDRLIIIDHITEDRRIAAYAMAGLSNAEIAAALARLAYGRLSGERIERR